MPDSFSCMLSLMNKFLSTPLTLSTLPRMKSTVTPQTAPMVLYMDIVFDIRDNQCLKATLHLPSGNECQTVDANQAYLKSTGLSLLVIGSVVYNPKPNLSPKSRDSLTQACRTYNVYFMIGCHTNICN